MKSTLSEEVIVSYLRYSEVLLVHRPGGLSMDEDSLYLDEDGLWSLGSRGALHTADSHSHVHDQRKVNKTRCGLQTVSEF